METCNKNYTCRVKSTETSKEANTLCINPSIGIQQFLVIVCML